MWLLLKYPKKLVKSSSCVGSGLSQQAVYFLHVVLVRCPFLLSFYAVLLCCPCRVLIHPPCTPSLYAILVRHPCMPSLYAILLQSLGWRLREPWNLSSRLDSHLDGHTNCTRHQMVVLDGHTRQSYQMVVSDSHCRRSYQTVVPGIGCHGHPIYKNIFNDNPMMAKHRLLWAINIQKYL
jgi:hypothetical protein